MIAFQAWLARGVRIESVSRANSSLLCSEVVRASGNCVIRIGPPAVDDHGAESQTWPGQLPGFSHLEGDPSREKEG